MAMSAENNQVANPFGSQAVAARQGGGLIAVEQQRAVAQVQAAMIVARTMPRDRRVIMDQILMDCTDIELAEEAEYEFSRGGSKITGPSIRLLETVARRWGNMESGVRELSRAAGYSECEAFAWDMETGYRDSKTFQVKHIRDTKTGSYALTDERDIYEAVANSAARRKRACMEAVIPTMVIRAAQEQCVLTLKNKIEITPEGIAQMLERFAAYKVTKQMIETRIQRHIDAITPGLWIMLRRIYNSLKDGMSGPGDWFEMGAAPSERDSNKAPTGATALKEAATKRAAAKSTAKDKAAAPADDSADLDTQQEAGLDAATKKGDSKSGGGGALKVTVAQVGDAIRVAKSADALDQAKDLIRYVPDEFHKDLLAQADAKFEEISPKGE
jgi:hypothetical protein